MWQECRRTEKATSRFFIGRIFGSRFFGAEKKLPSRFFSAPKKSNRYLFGAEKSATKVIPTEKSTGILLDLAINIVGFSIAEKVTGGFFIARLLAADFSAPKNTTSVNKSILSFLVHRELTFFPVNRQMTTHL